MSSRRFPSAGAGYTANPGRFLRGDNPIISSIFIYLVPWDLLFCLRLHPLSIGKSNHLESPSHHQLYTATAEMIFVWQLKAFSECLGPLTIVRLWILNVQDPPEADSGSHSTNNTSCRSMKISVA